MDIVKELQDFHGMPNSIDRQLLLDDAYSERYGLNVGITSNHPFGGALWRPSEEVSMRSPLYQRMRRYRDYHVYEIWNIELDKFLAMPREFTELILDECAKELQRRNKGNRKVTQEFDRGFKT